MIRRWGHGPDAVLFLHGFTGSAHSFDHLEPLLGDAVTATCVDLPGHRGAPVPEDFSAAIDGLLPLVAQPTAVIGYSQGARVALALALRSPAAVTKLVLEGGSAGLRQRRERMKRRLDDAQLAASITSLGVGAFLDQWERRPLFDGLRALPVPEREALRARRESHSAEGLAGALRCLGQGAQPDLGPSLPSLRVPTLLLSGALDEKYSMIARRLTAELPLAWSVSFPKTGHAPHLECPREYAAEVRAFLAARWTHEVHSPEERTHEA